MDWEPGQIHVWTDKQIKQWKADNPDGGERDGVIYRISTERIEYSAYQKVSFLPV